jgi:type IV conjugative transfer system protein TraE
VQIKKYISAWNNLHASLRLYQFLCVVLAALVVFMHFQNKQIMDEQKTILIPSHLKSKVSVSNDSANPEYIRIMMKYFVGLLSNYTPYNIDKRYMEFYSFVEEGMLPELEKQLDLRKSKVKKIGITQHFIINDIYLYSDQKCYIEGKAKRFVGSEMIAHENRFLKISYNFSNGEIYVQGIEELSGREFNAAVRS